MTIDGMTPAHAKPAGRRDHLWVLAVIAFAVLAEVWASWVGIGAMSGFPRIDNVPTDWVLAVAVEAYWGYALFAWLAAAPGPRSRAMAMWSCGGVFVLSLVSQVSYHELMAPAGATPGRRFVIGFASALPVVILALIAVLIHLRHLDREEAAEADERSAVQAEMDALRAELQAVREAHGGELEALAGDLKAAQNAHADAERRTAEALARAETAEKKLAAKTAQAKRSRNAQGAAKTAQDEDLTTELRALKLLDEEPALRGPRMGGELGRRLGVSAPTGRRLHARLTAQDRPADPLNERSRDTEGERSDERS